MNSIPKDDRVNFRSRLKCNGKDEKNSKTRGIGNRLEFREGNNRLMIQKKGEFKKIKRDSAAVIIGLKRDWLKRHLSA